MAIGEKIAIIIDNSGVSRVNVARRLGITSKSLYNKLEGKTDFKAEEIITVAEMFRLTREEVGDIFLG